MQCNVTIKKFYTYCGSCLLWLLLFKKYSEKYLKIMDWLNYTLIEAYKYKISTNVQLNIRMQEN